MKYRLLFASIVAAALVSSCSKEELQLQPQKPVTTTVMGVGSVYNGTIIVKMNEGEAPLTKSISTSVPDLGIYKIEPLFPHNERFAARHKKAGLDRWHIVSFNPEVPVAKAHNEFSKIGITEIVDYMPVIATTQSTALFNDPYLGYQWHYYKEGSSVGINLDKAWEITTGKENVIVAVLDGGIDYKHEDLKDAMWINMAERNGNTGIDDDNNGYVDDVYGYNFTAASNNSMTGILSADDHGTHVGGTVAAVNNNGKHGAGIAGGNGTSKGVRLMTCQTIEGNKGAYIGNAFVYAADNGAVITQNSWSLIEVTETPKHIIEAIDYFNTYAGLDENGNQVGPMAGGVSIFAAGNDNSAYGYPGMEKNVIAVAATGPSGIKASYSNFGEWVDIAAPGGDGGGEGSVFSTLPDNQFGAMQGTSMACPHVSGVAALIVSKYGGAGFTNEALKQRLLTSADEQKLYSKNENYLDGKKLGAGMLDAYAALMPNSTPDVVETFEATVKSNFITAKWEATFTNDLPTYGYKIYWHNKDLSEFDPSDPEADAIKYTYIKGEGTEAGTEMSHTFAVPFFNEDVYMRIQAINTFGEASALSKQITVHTEINYGPEFTPGDDINISLKSFDKKEYEFTVSDPDGHKVNRCEFDGGSAAATHSQTGNKVTVSIDATKTTPGEYKAMLHATDEYGGASTLYINYTILPNTPPSSIKDFDNTVLGKGESVTLNLTEYFADADGEKLKYEIESTEGVVADYGLVDNTLTLSGRTFGKTVITITALDGQKEKATASFALLVRDKKVPADIYPTQVSDHIYVRSGADGTYTLAIIGANGGEVYSNPSITTGPFNPYKVDASEWATGVYTILLKGNSTEYKTTIVKL